jgi:hypothetical protein
MNAQLEDAMNVTVLNKLPQSIDIGIVGAGNKAVSQRINALGRFGPIEQIKLTAYTLKLAKQGHVKLIPA